MRPIRAHQNSGLGAYKEVYKGTIVEVNDEDGEEGGELFANLNCVRSVGAGGAGIESILELSSLLPSSVHRRS